MMYQDPNFAKMADELGLDPELKELGIYMNKKEKYEDLIKAATAINKDTKGWYSVFHDSGQAVDYIMTKKYFGEKIDSNDAELLMRTLWQANDKPLANEISETILNNKEIFKNQKGLDVNDIDSVNAFANKVANSFCFLNTLLGNIILSPLDENIPKSAGDMYKKLYEQKMIYNDGVSVNININDLSGIQRLVNALVGENQLIVEGASIKQGLNNGAVNKYLVDYSNTNEDFKIGGVRIDGHSMLFIDGKTFDTGRPGNPYGPRKYGSDIREWTTKKNTNSIYFFKMK
jgi:hypothetical protein